MVLLAFAEFTSFFVFVVQLTPLTYSAGDSQFLLVFFSTSLQLDEACLSFPLPARLCRVLAFFISFFFCFSILPTDLAVGNTYSIISFFVFYYSSLFPEACLALLELLFLVESNRVSSFGCFVKV